MRRKFVEFSHTRILLFARKHTFETMKSTHNGVQLEPSVGQHHAENVESAIVHTYSTVTTTMFSLPCSATKLINFNRSKLLSAVVD